MVDDKIKEKEKGKKRKKKKKKEKARTERQRGASAKEMWLSCITVRSSPLARLREIYWRTTRKAPSLLVFTMVQFNLGVS